MWYVAGHLADGGCDLCDEAGLCACFGCDVGGLAAGVTSPDDQHVDVPAIVVDNFGQHHY
jgi:hypothetical protein